MKQTLLILTFALIGFTNLKAQTSYSCTYRQFCYLNEASQKYGNCEGYEESSLFKFNKDETLFIHTTETIKSTYYIESKQYDEKNDSYTCTVTSDVGNKYIYVFDRKNKEVRTTFKRDGKTTLLIFTVKAIF